MVLNDVFFIGLGGVVADGGLAVSFKPQPAPLRHGVGAVVVDRDAPVITDGLSQLFFAFRLGLGGHTFLDGPAGDWVDALGISALPAATGLFTDTALTVGPFLCHL